jgi:superfamily II DNA helicase RecQ
MHAVSSPMLEALEKHFSLSGFRPGQAEVISSVLAGRWW